MKNLYQTPARTRWDGSGGIFRKCAVLLLAVSLLPVTSSAAGSEPGRATSQTEVPPPAQGRAISGTVRDGKGDPIPGAAVTVVGGSLGVSTDASGVYRIEGVGSNDELEFSFLGMMSQKEKVGSRTQIDVTLREDMIGLEDVVVTGYTAMKRKDITGSVASVSAEQIARIPAYDLTTSLVGVAGIRVDGGSIRIRGTRSTNAGNDPLIVLDGIPYDETLTSINPGDIESIDILKDASSTAIYGAKGANGVILITTKQAKKGETKVTYDGFVGVGVNNWGTLDVMDADEYIAFQREASRAAGTWSSPEDDSKAFFGAEIANMGKMNTDWMGRYFNQKRLWHSHSLTIASGNEKTQYKISFNYKNNEERYKGDHRDYFYLTTDLTHQVLPFLKVGISNRAYYSVNNSMPGMFDTFLHMSPLTPVYNEDGSYNEYPFGDPFVKNPYMNETDGAYKDKTEEWKIYMRFFAQVDLYKGLTFNTNFAYTPAFTTMTTAAWVTPMSATSPACTTTARPTGYGTTSSTTRRPSASTPSTCRPSSRCRTARR